MAFEYSPLLKEGFQISAAADIEDIKERLQAAQGIITQLQLDVANLQSGKIAKISAVEQLTDLSNGQIFQWQGETTQDFTNGYFYKVESGTYPQVDTQNDYSLPIAAADLLGGVKVGNGLSIDETGILSVSAGGDMKVPKALQQSDLDDLDLNEIAQWQGVSTADYTNGYFYKKQIEHQIGDKVLQVANSQSFNLINDDGTITQDYYTIQQGDYVQKEGASPILSEHYVSSWVFTKGGENYRVYYIPVGSIDNQQNYPAVDSWFAMSSVDVPNSPIYIGQFKNITLNPIGTATAFVDNAGQTYTWDSTKVGLRWDNDVLDFSINDELIAIGIIDETHIQPTSFISVPVSGSVARCPLVCSFSQLVTPTYKYVRTNTQPNQLSVVDNVIKYTLSDLITQLNIAQLPNLISNLLDGHLIGWNSTTKMLETKTAAGTKYDSFDGTTFAGKTILGCCVHASGNGYSFTYYAARQTNDNKLYLYGINNTSTSRDSVTLDSVTTSANAWSSINASLQFAYFVYI